MSNGSTFVSTHCWANNVCQFDLSLTMVLFRSCSDCNDCSGLKLLPVRTAGQVGGNDCFAGFFGFFHGSLLQSSSCDINFSFSIYNCIISFSLTRRSDAVQLCFCFSVSLSLLRSKQRKFSISLRSLSSITITKLLFE